MHLHRHVPKQSKGFANECERFCVICDMIHKHGIQILMGDFNMALWQVCSELSNRGIHATLVAWFSWKAMGSGIPMCDSTGIFMLIPGVSVQRCCELSGAHDRDASDLLLHDRSCCPEWALVDPNAGPGQSSLVAYLKI